MDRRLRNIILVVMAVLCALPAVAQINGTGYYRFRNAQRTGDYISYANNLLDYNVIIGAGGNLMSMINDDAAQQRAVTCANRYMQTDIKMTEDPDCIDASTIVYAQRNTTVGTDNEYDFIGETVSLVNLLTGSFQQGLLSVQFGDIYAHIDTYEGEGANTKYTIYIELKGKLYGYLEHSFGKRYFQDYNGLFDMDEVITPLRAMWFIDPVTYFNVMPEVAFNGKYYTTIKVPFAFKLSGAVEKAYAITANNSGVLDYAVVASAGGTVPAGTPVLLECGSPDAADCQLKPTGAPLTNNNINYTGTNLLDGTYFCNTDGLQYFDTSAGTNSGSFNADNYIPNTDNAKKYVIGLTDSGKLGFVRATYTEMPANKAWLTSAGEFPWEVQTVSRGDVNADGKVDITDATMLINYLLSNDPTDINMENANCDLSEDNKVDITDATTLINFLLNNAWPEE
ncbi:MAG: hypothetical protein IKX18_03175 [Muribaculaceae bacterium]|nr:hypothetical protein [Muribaculaceae bacterium]